MREVLVINPRKGARKGKTTRRRKATTARKGVKIMARRKRRSTRRRAAAPVARVTTRRRKRRLRRNPSSPPSRGRRYARAAAGRLFGGLNFKTALHEALPVLAGMFAAKFGAKKFGGGSETDPTSWTWGTYLKAGAAAGVAAVLANMVRPGMGQKVLNGGICFLGFKLIQNELIVNNATAQGWFGADPNVLELDGEGTPWMVSDDGSALPMDERHRMMGADDLPELQGWGQDEGTWGEALVSPGSLGFGDALIQPGPLGQGDDIRAIQIAKYRAANMRG
jgi:hypothetical protein